MSKRHQNRSREPSKAMPVESPPDLATFSIDVAPETLLICEHIRLTIDRPAGRVACADCQAELSGELTVLFDGVPSGAGTEALTTAIQDDETVPPHLRCPACWGEFRGKAARRKWRRQVSGTLHERCYLCDQCGSEWIREFREEVEDGIVIATSRVKTIRLNLRVNDRDPDGTLAGYGQEGDGM